MKDLHDAFTEQGAAMLATILRSDRAIQINIEIMRTFVRLRQLLASHADLARKLRALERKYDGQFKVVFDALRELMKPPDLKNKRRIGFTLGLKKVPGHGCFMASSKPAFYYPSGSILLSKTNH